MFGLSVFEPFGLCVIGCFGVSICLLYLLLSMCIVYPISGVLLPTVCVLPVRNGCLHLTARITLLRAQCQVSVSEHIKGEWILQL